MNGYTDSTINQNRPGRLQKSEMMTPQKIQARDDKLLK